jgi:hypothetical protein
MKKTILTFAIGSLLIGTSVISCKTSSEKVENAQENVVDAQEDLAGAKQELTQARRDSILQWRAESQEKIGAYEKSIIDLKSKIAKQKQANKASYEQSIVVLEQKNADVKRKLEEYKEEGDTNWEDFKTEFNHDMDELGNAFKDLTIKNTK